MVIVLEIIYLRLQEENAKFILFEKRKPLMNRFIQWNGEREKLSNAEEREIVIMEKKSPVLLIMWSRIREAKRKAYRKSGVGGKIKCRS